MPQQPQSSVQDVICNQVMTYLTGCMLQNPCKTQLQYAVEDGVRKICFCVRDDAVLAVPPVGSIGAPAKSTEMAAVKVDILEVVQAVGQRLVGNKILEELARRNIAWGDTTVKIALSDLVRDGKLTNRQDTRPKGYGLPEWS